MLNAKAVNVKPVYIFFSGGRCIGRYDLVKTIYNAVPKTFIFKYKEPGNAQFFYLDQKVYQ